MSKKFSNKKTTSEPSMATDARQSTSIKVGAKWHFVAEYLELLVNAGIKFDDEFDRRYERLMDYVRGKIALPKNCDITDEYFVYEIDTPEENGK